MQDKGRILIRCGLCGFWGGLIGLAHGGGGRESVAKGAEGTAKRF